MSLEPFVDMRRLASLSEALLHRNGYSAEGRKDMDEASRRP
jgi:hypothetical protein